MKRDLCGKYGYEIGGRSPQGERGLKHALIRRKPHERRSLPARGAWVET